MKKKFLIYVIIILAINLISLHAVSDFLTYNVTVEIYFDEDNHVVVDNLEVKYRTKISLMEKFNSTFSNYEFKYCLIDDFIITDNINYSFEVTKNAKVSALFKPLDKVVVVFVDDNNSLLKVEYLDKGAVFEKESFYDDRLLNKVGYKFDKWYTSEEVFAPQAINSDVLVKASYKALDKRNPYRLIVFNGSIPSGQYYYPFGQVVNVVANEAPEGKEFIYWQDERGIIVSPSPNFKFMIMNNTNLTAMYGDIGTRDNEPFININVVTSVIEVKKITYVNQFYFPQSNNYKFIEVGMLMINTNENVEMSLLELDNNFRVKDPRVVRGSAVALTPYNEFLMSKTNVNLDDIWSSRSYIIYEDSEGIKIKYSSQMIKIKEVKGGKEIL